MQPEDAQWGQNEAEERDEGAQAHPAHSVHAKLIRMANQIATFFDSQRAANRAEGVAIHINKFWEPRMRKALFAHLDEGGAGLHPLVLEAADLIRRPHEDPDNAPGTGQDATAGATGGKGSAAGESKSEPNFPEH